MINKENIISVKRIFLISFFLYTAVCLLFLQLVINLENEIKKSLITSNTIRATYPNYQKEPDLALEIFNELNEQRSEYRSFVGYRRSEYIGSTTNIDDFGFKNPQIMRSIIQFGF